MKHSGSILDARALENCLEALEAQTGDVKVDPDPGESASFCEAGKTSRPADPETDPHPCKLSSANLYIFSRKF
jgi:hypothetical protein